MGPATTAIAAPPDPQPCQSQIAAAQALEQQIEAHNAEPHVFELPDQEGAYEEYNAEAGTLNAEEDAAKEALEQCATALQDLIGNDPNGPAPKQTAPPKMVNLLSAGQQKLPPGWTPPPQSTPGYWTVPPQARPIYLALRQTKMTDIVKNADLQGQPKPQVGDPDPALPGGQIRGNVNTGAPLVQIDHIVPLAQIMNMPGFTQLTPDNMYAVANAPINLQWLSQWANGLKSSQSAALMAGVDPSWQAAQIALEKQRAAQLQQIINQLLASQQAGQK